VVYGAYKVLAPDSAAPASAAEAPARGAIAAPRDAPGNDDRERDERAARVCNETRARVMRGASIGPTDVEGWVVELSLLRGGDTPPLGFDPGLGAFIKRPPGHDTGSFAWPGAAELSAIGGPMTRVTVADGALPPTGKAQFQGVTLSFSGRYVTPYFSKDQRGSYLKTADALATRLGAVYGGLYAHCAGGTTHHIGSWFRGPGPAGAAAALVYFVGTYAPGAHVRASVLGQGDRAGALERIAAATQKLDRRHVATLLGDSGGSIAGRADGPTTITFPFSEANRAERASQTIASAVGLGH
jgi:serine/threonine-protein kinase